MQVSATAAATTSNTAATSSRTSTTSSTGTKSVDSQMFLQLLVAQLRNQDPMNPTDSQQFLGQMAQLQTVDQLTSISQMLQAQQEMDALSQSLMLIGKKVEYSDATGQAKQSGTVQGVQFDQGLPTLIVDGKSVLPGDVVSVSNG